MHGEYEATTKVIRALQVMVKDVKIRAFLEANDPNALKQAEDALDVIMNGPVSNPDPA
jgi:hypothetical protein